MKYILASALALMALSLSSCKENREEQIRKEVEMRVEQEKQLMKAQAEVEAAKAEAARAKAEATVAQAKAEQAKAAAKSAQQTRYSNSSNSPYGTLVMVKREGGYTNIRSGCSSSSAIVEKVRDGSYIKVGDNYGQWYEVYDANGDVKGYIHASKIVF